ncbi:MAG: RloB domain-containing protein [Clostridia bacterium]|nr:RloB domain-containing protein [Clostridia bacterium]
MSKKQPGYSPKRRNAYQRKRKSIILLAAEGDNKTETLYFSSLSNSDYVVRFTHGNFTDPVKMVNQLKSEYQDLELDAELGDKAFCLIDSDTDPAKDNQIREADGKAGKTIRVLVSSPCFEVWYLCHFSASARMYGSSAEVVKALKKHIPEYRKEMKDIRKIIGDKTKTAIRNAKELEKRCLANGLKKHTVSFTPSTEVYQIVELLTDPE